MKFCKKPFEQMYISINHVKTCPWMDIIIGRPLDGSLEELWNGEMAELSRESIRDGSFRFCNKESCPFCASGKLEEIDEEECKNYVAEPSPTYINVSYDKFCNHACPSCRKDYFIPNKEYIERMNIIKEVVIPLVNKTKTLSACGQGDCFASPYIMELLKEIKPQRSDFNITFETNGVYFDEKHWNELSHLHKYPISVIVTPNSLEKYTYRYLAGGIDDYEKCMQSMKFLSKLRSDNKIVSLKINMVVQESNYREIPSFVQRCLDEFNPDMIRVKPINRWFSLDAEGYWYMNVLNPLHPHHENYLAVMSDPVLKNPKVWDWSEDIHDRDPQKHPAAYYEDYADFMYKLVMCENRREYLKKKLDEYNIHTISIYGAWKWGGMLFDVLKDVDGYSINSFIDRKLGDKGKQYRNLPIKGIWKEGIVEDDMIIVSAIAYYEEIKRDLKRKGYNGTVISMSDLL